MVDQLFPGQRLNVNESLVNGALTLIMQGDGNLVLYRTDYNPWKARWATGTDGTTASYAILQDDGNLVLYGNSPAEAPHLAKWCSNTWGNYQGPYLDLTDSGDLVLHDQKGRIVNLTPLDPIFGN